jgi:hypothetical protein
MPQLSLDEAIRQWSVSQGGTIEEQKLRTTILIRLRSELEYIDRFRAKGNTTLRITHPEGRVKKAYLQDREI